MHPGGRSGLADRRRSLYPSLCAMRNPHVHFHCVVIEGASRPLPKAARVFTQPTVSIDARPTPCRVDRFYTEASSDAPDLSNTLI